MNPGDAICCLNTVDRRKRRAVRLLAKTRETTQADWRQSSISGDLRHATDAVLLWNSHGVPIVVFDELIDVEKSYVQFVDERWTKYHGVASSNRIRWKAVVQRSILSNSYTWQRAGLCVVTEASVKDA